MMARDKELPGQFGGLNRWGMPVLPLLIGTVVPLATVLLAPDVGVLAELYAIGVVGAMRAFGKDAAADPDPRALGEYAFLVATLSLLTLVSESP